MAQVRVLRLVANLGSLHTTQVLDYPSAAVRSRSISWRARSSGVIGMGKMDYSQTERHLTQADGRFWEPFVLAIGLWETSTMPPDSRSAKAR